jgi:hypothetical protein
MDINPLQSLANYRRFVAVMLHRPTVVRSMVVGWPASGSRLGRRDSPPATLRPQAPGARKLPDNSDQKGGERHPESGTDQPHPRLFPMHGAPEGWPNSRQSPSVVEGSSAS